MKRIIRIILLIAVITGLVFAGGGLRNLFYPEKVKAFGDLTVNFHVAPNAPIFTITNMAPGDTQSRIVDVTNGGTLAHIVALKGIKTLGVGTPHIEDVLTIIILDGATPVYGAGSVTGPKTVQDFFTGSNSPDGIVLGLINPSGHKAYTLTVTFPASAGNAYQGKSVTLDITFGTSDIVNVVINEVYYKVDSSHGQDSPKDRNEKKGLGINNEWIELFNPTDHDVNLKNWTLTDNSGQISIIHPNVVLPSGAFAILSKDNSTWKYWNANKKIITIELGNQIGDGLDNSGDHLILKDNTGTEIDRTSWGTDTSGFTPFATNPLVSLGSSTERIFPGFDTNKVSDWHENHSPTPGF